MIDQPTAQQEEALFAEWLDAACMVYSLEDDVVEPAPHTHLSKSDLLQLIRVARKQALDQAIQLRDSLVKEPHGWNSFSYTRAANDYADAIERLKGKA